MPRPEVLGKNGTYVVFRKLHQRVAAFRQYLKANSSSPEEEDLLGAKMMGRWQSGAPLALCPMHDDPELGADPKRNNDFLFKEDDPQGLKTPPGSHIRRMNPRDSDISGFMRFHRMIRRGTSYGPMLPPGVIEDDGAERGLAFVFVGASLERQFEFVQRSGSTKDSSFMALPTIRIQSRARTTEADRSPSRNSRSAGGYRVCRLSSSHGEASISSRPACARCAGWPISRPDEDAAIERADRTSDGAVGMRAG